MNPTFSPLKCMMLNVDSGYDLKAYQYAPNVLISSDLWLGHLYILAMNQKTWDALSPQNQAAIQRAAQTAYRALGAVMKRSVDRQLDVLRKAGATVRVLRPEEVVQWQEVTRYQAAQTRWVREQEANGVVDAGAVMKQVTALVQASLTPQAH